MDDIGRIVDFLIEHNKYEDRELLKKYIEEHREYGTLDYAIDTNGAIVAVCRWNVSADGNVADILDFAIRDSHRNKGIGGNFIVRAMRKFPKLESLEFTRGVRGDMRVKKLSIKGILKRNIF